MVEYLEDILRNGRVYELIEFSTKRNTIGKIYLNPERMTNTWTLLLTLIHEISHIATMSYDVAYASAGSITEDGYDLQFGSLVKLAAKAEGSRLLPEKSWVLDILWSLENSSNQRSAPTLGEVYAAHNAETIATCILGVFVINSNYGFLDVSRQLLCPVRRQL